MTKPKSKRPSESAPDGGEVLLYQTEDGQLRIDCRFQGGSLWLAQRLIADLFQVSVPTVNEHLKGIYAEGELTPEATIRKFRIVQPEGNRQVERLVDHYHLNAILAVGYRVRSRRGTQFRQWATARLEEYLRKGFVMDDERLKNPPGPGVPDYFDELLERIREIRASEKRMYLQETLDMHVNWQDYIESTPDVLRGKPRIKGTRIPVSLLLGYLAEGYSVENIIAECPDLTGQQIAACLDYARELAAFEVDV